MDILLYMVHSNYVQVLVSMIGRIRAVGGSKRRLELIAKGVLGEVVVYMDKHLDKGLRIMQTEPPPKAGSFYVRTHTYQRSWTRTDVRLTNEGLIGSLNSNAVDPYGAHYTVIVGGDEQGVGQLEMHSSTGWPLLAEVLRNGYVQGLKEVIHDALQ